MRVAVQGSNSRTPDRLAAKLGAARSCVAVSLLLCLLAAAPPIAAERPKTRQAFSAAMARVVASIRWQEAIDDERPEGMPEAEVLALLGPPDETGLPGMRRADDAYVESGERLLRYGTDGPGTLATLGAVLINSSGRATRVYGGKGKPPDPRIVSERELRRLMRLLDRLPDLSSSGRQFDPLNLIQIVNALQPLGKERVLAVINEYCRVRYAPLTPEGFEYHDWGSVNRSSLHGVMYLLFELPAELPADSEFFPWDYSLVLVSGVPLMMWDGGGIGGSVNFGLFHLYHYRKLGTLRSHPLRPPPRPWEAVDALQSNPDWQRAGPGERKRMRELAANQVLRLLSTVHESEPNRYGEKVPSGPEFETRWQETVRELERLKIRWDAKRNTYTFSDGTYHRSAQRRPPRTYKWRTSLNGTRVEVSFHRWSAYMVNVSLAWKGKGLEALPQDSALRVYAGSDRIRVGTFRPPPGGRTDHHVSVTEGAKLWAELSIGDRRKVGTAFRP